MKEGLVPILCTGEDRLLCGASARWTHIPLHWSFIFWEWGVLRGTLGGTARWGGGGGGGVAGGGWVLPVKNLMFQWLLHTSKVRCRFGVHCMNRSCCRTSPLRTLVPVCWSVLCWWEEGGWVEGGRWRRGCVCQRGCLKGLRGGGKLKMLEVNSRAWKVHGFWHECLVRVMMDCVYTDIQASPPSVDLPLLNPLAAPTSPAAVYVQWGWEEGEGGRESVHVDLGWRERESDRDSVVQEWEWMLICGAQKSLCWHECWWVRRVLRNGAQKLLCWQPQKLLSAWMLMGQEGF